MDTRQHCFEMLLNKPVVILDTETTGLDTTAEIIDIAVTDPAGTPLLNTLVKPQMPIGSPATKIHGITNEMVATAPTWDLVFPELLRVIKDKLVVIYNAEFDIRLMFQSSDRYNLQIPDRFGTQGFFCAMLEYSHWVAKHDYFRAQNRYISLAAACRNEGVPAIGAHRAYPDTMMVNGVIRSVLNKASAMRANPYV